LIFAKSPALDLLTAQMFLSEKLFDEDPKLLQNAVLVRVFGFFLSSAGNNPMLGSLSVSLFKKYD